MYLIKMGHNFYYTTDSFKKAMETAVQFYRDGGECDVIYTTNDTILAVFRTNRVEFYFGPNPQDLL